MFDEEKAKREIQELVDKYERIVSSGEIKDYSEEDTKNDFILPLFEILGWDTKNRISKEVKLEKKVSNGRVDFAFKADGITRFFVEAKKFRENIEDRKWADQAINYSYLKGITWAILTNFKKLKVYNAEARGGTLFSMTLMDLKYDEFISKFDMLALLSKESILRERLDKEAEKIYKKLPRVPIGKKLLEDLENARETISKNIIKNNQARGLTENQLEECVQRILSRLVFIRSIEDRKYEDPLLKPLLTDKNLKKSVPDELNDIYRQLDKKYDAKLFDKHLCEDLVIDAYPLKTIFESLYSLDEDLKKYDFSIIDADILGGIYEDYLGKVVKYNDKKLEVKKKKRQK